MSGRAKLWMVLFAALMIPGIVLARTWTSREGKTIEGDFVDVDQERLTIERDGKEIKIRLELLCDEDQLFLKGVLARRALKKQETLTESDPDSPFETIGGAKPAESLTEAVGRDSDSADSSDEGSGSAKKKKAENRTWTDRLGNKSQGKFIRIQGNTVVLLRTGRQITTDYWQLSDEDQQYVRELLESNDLAHLVPKVNPSTVAANNNGNNGGNPIRTPFDGALPYGAGNAGAGTTSSPAPSTDYSAPSYTAPAYSGPSYSEPTTPATTPSYPVPDYSSSSSPSYGSSAPSYGGASTPSYSAPSIPSYTSPTFTSPSVMTKVCENCGKELPSHFTAGDTCPGCGVYFSHDDTNGKTAYGGGNWSFRPGRGAAKLVIWLVIIVVGGIASLIGGAIKLMSGGSKNVDEYGA